MMYQMMQQPMPVQPSLQFLLQPLAPLFLTLELSVIVVLAASTQVHVPSYLAFGRRNGQSLVHLAGAQCLRVA